MRAKVSHCPDDPDRKSPMDGLAEFTNVNSGPVVGWVRKGTAKQVHFILPSGTSLCGRVRGPDRRHGRVQVYPGWNPKDDDTCPTCALFFKDIKKPQ